MDTRNTNQLIAFLNHCEEQYSLNPYFRIDAKSAETALDFIRNGADVNAVSHQHHFQLLHLLAKFLDNDSLEDSIIQSVKTNNADITAKDTKGNTPFTYYLSRNSINVDAAMRFLYFGADLYTKNFNGESLLHIFVRLSQSDDNYTYTKAIAQLITQYYFDLERQDSASLTALQRLLSRSFSTSVAMLLVQLGADPNTKYCNETLLDILSQPNNNQNGRNNEAIQELEAKIENYTSKQAQEQNVLLKLQQNKYDENCFEIDSHKDTHHFFDHAIKKILHNQSIRKLSILNTYLDSTRMERLIDAINHSQITHLVLDGVFIQKDAQTKLGRLLSTNTTLINFAVNLHLESFAYIDGMKAIAEGLSANKSLINLTMHDCEDTHVQFICQALTINNTLQTLHLGNHQFSKKSLIELMHKKKNPNLKILCIDTNLYVGANSEVDLTMKRSKLEVLKTVKVKNPEDIQRYKQEIAIMNELTLNNATHVVRFHDAEVVIDPGTHYHIYMEFMPNGTLSKAIKKDRPCLNGWLNKQNLILKVAIGLNFIHQYGIVHRDFKCGNILFDDNWEPKIADFGFSTKNPGPGYWGTTCFASPETIQEVAQTFKSDIFSYGMVAWCVITMQSSPYKGVQEQQLIALRQANHRPEIPHICPVKIKDILRLCWHGDPKKRPFASELILDLQSKIDEPLSDNMALKLKNL